MNHNQLQKIRDYSRNSWLKKHHAKAAADATYLGLRRANKSQLVSIHGSQAMNHNQLQKIRENSRLKKHHA